ncbi:MAG: tRNA pseudouridine(55) synthase TruB [Deltaproteobacteria bacterium]|nr:tRNA pseudouridine(55) synthase TruB [Deltaproteobacteria bacterium]
MAVQEKNASLNGILVIDKPPGLSSARVVSIVKRLLQVPKVGHAGTLDPFATGVLIVCVNQATRLARFWLNSAKTYQAELCLGIETDTQDPTGIVISTCEAVDIPEDTLRAVTKSFVGTVNQAPPVYSALKHQGVPLYSLARKGKPFQKPARQIQIYRLELLEIALPLVRFEVSCSAGTYVRTLCADIGKILGCGGHLKNLRRTASSGYSITDAISLSELEELVRSGDVARHLTGMAEALPDMVSFQADKALTDKLKYGMMITTADVPPSCLLPGENLVKIIDGNNRLLSILSHDPVQHGFTYCCSFM